MTSNLTIRCDYTISHWQSQRHKGVRLVSRRSVITLICLDDLVAATRGFCGTGRFPRMQRFESGNVLKDSEHHLVELLSYEARQNSCSATIWRNVICSSLSM